MRPVKPTKKEKECLDPAWLAKTAKLAMKRGTAIIFGKDRSVYGILPKGGGSINVFYETDPQWVDAVLALHPGGAVFPCGDVGGGSATAKALRAYANVRLPEDGGGKAWIDAVTNVVHVKGVGITVHSATLEPDDTPVPASPDDMTAIDIAGQVPKDIGKLLMEFTRRDDNRPNLRRIYHRMSANGEFLGATDSRSAILHTVTDIPHGFSVDPTLVNPFDIVAYSREVTDTGAEIHRYRLADGTVFVEKLAGIEAKDVCAVVDGVFACACAPLIGVSALLRLNEDIAALGLGAEDKFGGVAAFSRSGVGILSGEQPVAEIETEIRLKDDLVARFALPILARLAKLNADVSVTVGAGMNVARCETDTTWAIAAPMTPPVAPGAAT